jgi:hypothetical protein
MLAKKEVAGKMLLDQMLYTLTPEQVKMCALYNTVMQDFDEAYKHLNILSRDTVKQAKEGSSVPFKGATVIKLTTDAVPEILKYRHVLFFRVRDFKESGKYRMLPRMAAVRICGRLYVALNAVDVRVETPIIATIDN